uniref:TELO2-interacting protein 2 n=1 Tax=Lygus hesperus TaxID=30085 RepID=A0A146L041_LYGHE
MMIEQQNDLLEALKCCIVPPCVHGIDRPITDSDFLDYTSVIDDRLASASSAFLSSTAPVHLRDDVISTLIVVCGQHSNPSIWTTDVSVALCREVFESFASVFYEKHERSVFQEPKILKKTLILLRPYLLSTTFKCNPAAVVCYAWILKQIKSPFLGECLSDLLPSALIISDDFEPQNIKIGFDCLYHIIENVALEQLKWYGQDEVILDALRKSLYQTDPEIVSSQLPCYIALMKRYLMQSTTLKRNQFDDVIKTILFNMYVESKYDLRQIYSSNIAGIIEARGPGVIRHLSMLFKVLSEYALEPTSTLEALKALDQIVRVCWCRGPTICDEVVTILGKLLIELSVNTTKYNVEDVVSASRQTANLLKKEFPERVSDFLQHFCVSDTIDEKLMDLVKRTFSEPTTTSTNIT